MTSEVMEELAAVKAIASKAWGSQQEQKKGKIRRSQERKWEAQGSAEERPWSMLWMWWNRTHSSENAPTPIRSL